eukprot:Em0001g1026a
MGKGTSKIQKLALLSISLLLQLILFFSSLVLNILTQQASSENTISIVNNVVKGLQAAAVIGPCITSIIVYCILVHMVKCVRVYFAATFDDQILKERCTIDIKKGNCCISRRARIRWFVAYTLLRNPDLQCLTSNRLNEAKLSNAASANEKTDNDVSS